MLDARNLENPLEVITSSSDIDSITGISVSNDGDSLLSISMNGTAHLWDIRPFCESEDRLQYTYHKISSNFDMNLLRIRWSPDDLTFSAGTSERVVNIHKVRPDINDMDTLVRSLGNVHEGTINESVFHPKQRYAVLSCSSDKNLLYQSEIC
jgi:WD40 repeat protein